MNKAQSRRQDRVQHLLAHLDVVEQDVATEILKLHKITKGVKELQRIQADIKRVKDDIISAILK